MAHAAHQQVNTVQAANSVTAARRMDTVGIRSSIVDGGVRLVLGIVGWGRLGGGGFVRGVMDEVDDG